MLAVIADQARRSDKDIADVSLEQGQSGGQDEEPAPTQGERAMKACPDCAELVLEAARKCRYCGYRFDRPSSKAPQEGLFAHLLRRPAQHLTMIETLEQLGVELRPGERPVGLWLAQVTGVDGYVVLTDERLCFVMGLRHRNETRAPWQRPLTELEGAEISTHRRKATLVLRWRDSPAMSIDGLAQKDLQRRHSALLDRVSS
jgi:hypothetical protein